MRGRGSRPSTEVSLSAAGKVYTLCAVLLYCWTRSFLVGYAAAGVIEPDEAPIEAMYRAIAKGANIMLRDRVTARWRELEDILGAGLHHDPAHRPTAAEFANMAPLRLGRRGPMLR
jgi:hypothetical protein